MDPIMLEKAIIDRKKATGKNPRAIILVHLYGMPAKMDEIIEVCKRYQIPMIEDAAEAIGASYKGKKLGAFGEIGIFSFNGNKIITTSGGGALVSSNKSWVDKAKFLATQARDNAPHYQHSEVGYNYRLSNISAGIGRGQLKVLDNRVKQRRANFERYKMLFDATNDVEFLEEPDGFHSNRWLTTVLFKNNQMREKVRLTLEQEDIESRPLWKPMHLQPIFAAYPCYNEGYSEQLFKRGLCLPSGSNLSFDNIEKVAISVKKVLE
jgi:dTDP-4-amino-4,6-dideoxygalactose transaminase